MDKDYKDDHCPNCGRSSYRTAKLKGIRTCNRCGHEWHVDLPAKAARNNMKEEDGED